jgi:hypothetical protein
MLVMLLAALDSTIVATALPTGLGIAPDALGGYLDPTAAVVALGRRLRELRDSGIHEMPRTLPREPQRFGGFRPYSLVLPGHEPIGANG